MSDTQRAWLEETLQKTKSLKHTFVFIHHPRWVKKTYPGANWDDVHNLLKASGNVRAVFAGHVHRTRYDGNRDGIDYVTLATTGGSMPGNYPEAGFLHHIDIVSVRPDGVKISMLPVGAVIDPKKYTPELIAEVEGLRGMGLGLTAAPIGLDANGRGAGLVEFKLTNPAKSDLEIAVTPSEEPGEWISSAERVQFVLRPGETKQGSFSMMRVREGLGGKVSEPSVFKTAEPKILRLDGKSAVRIEMGNKKLPDGPFTVEAWVLPGDKADGDIISKAEQSEFALNLLKNEPGFHAFIDERYTSAISTEALPAGQWAHLAGVFDGKAMTLYVNGKPVATTPAAGKRTLNAQPLYIGANPDAKSEPTGFFTGAIDEARLSSSARYTAAFTPERNFTRDDKTVYLFHCDKLAGPFLPSDSAGGSYGTFTGKPELVAP
jgi:hypothetical protein